MSNAWHACTAVVAVRRADGTDPGAHVLYAPACSRCGWRSELRFTDGLTAVAAARQEHGHVHCAPVGAQTALGLA